MKTVPRIALSAWLVLLCVSVWLIGRVPINTDLAAFLPPSAAPSQQVLLDQMRNGVASRIMLIAIEGDDADRLARSSAALSRLLDASDDFVWVNNGDASLLRVERDYVMRNRYLLSPAVDPARFTVEGLRAALQDTLELLASPLGAFLRESVPADPTGEFANAVSGLGTGGGPSRHDGVWLSADKRRALLLAETRATGFDAVQQQQAVHTARTAFAGLENAPGDRLLLSGPGVFAAESRAVIRQDSWRLSLTAGLIVLLVLTVVHRSMRVVLLCTLPVITGLVVGTAAVCLVFDSVHGITLGFGATLIGEAVDYPTYVFLSARRGETARDTVTRIWPTLRMAVLTTMFGGLTLLGSGFSGLSQLGLLAVAGVLSAGMVTRWVLPEMAGAPRSLHAPTALAHAVARPTRRTKSMVALACGALALAVIAWAHERMWSDDLSDLSPISAQSRAMDRQLRDELQAPDVRHLVVVSAETRQQALERSETVATGLQTLVDDGRLGGFEHAAAYVPSHALQQRRRSALPDPDELEQRLTAALAGMPFRDGLFQPFLRDVADTRSRPPLQASDLDESAITARIRALLFESDHGWVALMALRGVDDPRVLTTLLDMDGNEHVLVVDLKQVSFEMVSNYRDEALKFTAIGMVAILLLLLGGLRTLTDAARVVLPVVLAVLIAVATLLVAGQRLTVFHVVALLLVIGIGMNYALFFNRPDPDSVSRAQTLLAIGVCAVTTCAAFSALAFSQTPVLRAIGMTVGLGATASLLLSAVLAQRSAGTPAARADHD